jgi:hypothetical protein
VSAATPKLRCILILSIISPSLLFLTNLKTYQDW